MDDNAKNLRYTGRFGQIWICLGRLFRIFVFQSEWKVLPMAAIIAGLVSMAVGSGLFSSMEGTLQGSLALACVCIWNGFFNSIQSICRERPIIKREHRAGMHITSYVLAQAIYQLILCCLQAVITISVCRFAGVVMPAAGVLTDEPIVELCVTLFLVTFSADMLALLISALVHSTTAAMTIMPFMLIVQLVFAGFFSLPAALKDLSDLMISKWGVRALCGIGHYNDLPAVVIWNRLSSAGDKIDLGGIMTVGDMIRIIEEQGMRDQIMYELGKANFSADYASTVENMISCWGHLAVYAFIYLAITVLLLEFIDHDRR